ncbi:type II secretion system F family protein [Pseudorhodobacter sp.]|uniref:type II secretion system F family protein n=1 Tax=Pseudorhodobacter sp. TaxID=1934400 RepID=UPI002649C639|nr:type II secretion system F family protein [Pseudorhodobacter sp.]MDN5788098.1 type II secretion system F family protein [Pseudorhodobacter sp.]
MLASINEMLVTKLGPFGPLIVIGGIGLLLILVTLPTMLKKTPEPFEKIKMQRNAYKSPKEQGLRVGTSGGAGDKLQKFSTFLEPQNAEEMSASRMRMLRAGYRAKNAVQLFHFAQLALGIGFLILGVAYTMFLQTKGDISSQAMIMWTIGPGAAGYFLPKYWIQRRVQQRQEEIISGFPDALDMMLVCVEAGQSLDQSIMRVAKESRAGYPALADEFDSVANEVKAGKERVAVLRDMSDRVGVADVASFVTTLVQSATFGTSIAEALRVYSAEMRDKRVMRAEEKANKLPTKLTLGTMMFTVPPLMIILIGPSVHGIAKTLGGG